jgi:hypothetical protein
VNRPNIDGYVSPGFERVRDAFRDNFSHRRELGGACCAYYGGEKIVDRTLGQFFQDEIATPLGEDFYIRLPERSPTRVSPLCHRRA